MEKKLGLSALTALVLSSMLGARRCQSGCVVNWLGHYRRGDTLTGIRHVNPYAHSLRA